MGFDAVSTSTVFTTPPPPSPSQIASFFAHRVILLTGLTGFLGKNVLAQILIHCPKVQKVYCLIRSRGQYTSRQRLEQTIFSLGFYQDIFRENPEIKQKIEVLDGDISREDCGLEEETIGLLAEKVNVILHCAANTKFLEGLKLAIGLNTLGPLRVLKFAKRCKNLLAFVHVSTAYVNCPLNSSKENQILEQIYPSIFNPFQVIAKVSAMTDAEADAQTSQLIAPYPNTYTFSKALGESLLFSQRENVPISIVRPSIICCAYRYPYAGWLDSMIGANGLFIMSALGLLRFVIGQGNNIVDFVPVDMVASTIIAVAWRTFLQYDKDNEIVHDSTTLGKSPSYSITLQPSSTIKAPPSPSNCIYHATTSTKNGSQWAMARSIVLSYFLRHPLNKAIGPSWTIFISSNLCHYWLHLCFEFIPACLLDFKSMVTNKPKKAIRTTNMLNNTVKTLSYFMSNQWFYGGQNIDEIISEMNREDLKRFPIDVTTINWELYFLIYAQGLEKYFNQKKMEESTNSKTESKL